MRNVINNMSVHVHLHYNFNSHFLLSSELKAFLLYCTGTTRFPLRKSIRIDFNDSDAIAVHTCDQLLVLPVGLLTTDYDKFEEVLNSVIVDNPTFNAI